MSNDFAVKGNIVYAPKMGELSVIEQGYIVVRDGKAAEILPEYSGGVVDYGNSLIIPGLCDMHLHAPQYAMMGMGMDMELLPWLQTYTFPEESKYADAAYAKEVYGRFAQALVQAGTTRACVFGTIHTDTVLMLMEILEQAGITAYVGKVNMDRNAPGSLCESVGESLEETERWLAASMGKFSHVKPMITPRFVPSCSGPLLRGLGEIAGKYAIPVQSHLSESRDEGRWVGELEPEAGCYGAAYEQYGLFGGDTPTVMAHCVHSCADEVRLMAQNKVLMAHCPDSNSNLASGMADVRGMLDAGVPVALGSDIAGGSSVSILDVAAKAIRISKLRQAEGRGKCLSLPEAFYLATSAGAAFFGDAPGFASGAPFHAVVLDDAHMINTQRLSVPERLERALYLNRDIHIQAVYANGKKIL